MEHHLYKDRSGTTGLNRFRKLVAKDVTKMSLGEQLKRLKRSCDRVTVSIRKAALKGDDAKVQRLSGLLGNQQARAQYVALRLSEALALEPRTLPSGDKLLPVHTYYATGRVKARFDTEWLNKALAFDDAEDGTETKIEKKGRNGRFYVISTRIL